jgi:ribonuclease BN (tRNA processing enzyme)
MSNMRLTVIGCSPSWPNPGGANSGYLLEGAGSLLLDCGPGVVARLRERGAWPAIDAVAITHFHLDHWGDLVPWVWGALYLERRGASLNRPQLWVPPGGTATLEDFGARLAHSGMFARVFDICEYRPGEPFSASGYAVTPMQVPHYGFETYGFRVTDGSRTLAYSADSAPDAALEELAGNADLFLCEATLDSGDDDGELRGHLSLDEAQAAFAASGAKRLVAVHRPVELDSPGLAEVAYDGMVVELPPFDPMT